MAKSNTVINLRAQTLQRELIDRAAAVQGKKRTEFMLEAACDKASEVLLNQTFFALDVEAYQRFVAMLDAPTLPNPHLERLLATQAPWDR